MAAARLSVGDDPREAGSAGADERTTGTMATWIRSKKKPNWWQANETQTKNFKSSDHMSTAESHVALIK